MPWPLGMVIEPPKPPRPEPWNKRIGDVVQEGIEAIVDLVLPGKL